MFVALEGPEGSGKSTAAAGLANLLQQAGRGVVVTREPGAGELGQRIRSILLDGPDMPPLSELFLFLADRANHMVETIKPAIDSGKVVLCDRHADSTVVYQGHARGLDVAELRRLNALATGGIKPDLVLLFDLPVEVGLARVESKDRLDAEPVSFHEKVRAGFLAEASLDPGRWVVLDASQEPEKVLADAWQALSAALAGN